jgi:hypothetical protein
MEENTGNLFIISPRKRTQKIDNSMVVLEFNQIFFLKKEEHFKFPIK